MNPICCKDLPEECWELIINKLDHHSYFESLSLVNKRFLSLTNRLRHRLNITSPTYQIHGTISNLIHRFPNLKTLNLCDLHGCDATVVLFEISRCSLLNLESLDISNHKCIPIRGIRELGLSMQKNLQILQCSYLHKLCDSDIMAVVQCFPLLEEIDISYPTNDLDSHSQFHALRTSEFAVTDDGMEVLASRLKNLRKIDISGNLFLTDKSVLALSMNCEFLREIIILHCPLITMKGVNCLLNHSPQLCVISMGGIATTSGPSMVQSTSFGRALSTLDIQYSSISDEFLCSLAKACIPLKSICLLCCTGYTIGGIWFLLYTYRSLECLDLSENNFLTDQSIIELSIYLQVLVSIKLNLCPKLTESTLHTLAKNCPYLQDIGMRRANFTNDGLLMELVRNPSIKSLDLALNSGLGDECLATIALVCPNLELLDINSCQGITDEGITNVLRSCGKMRHLFVNDCTRVKKLGLIAELPTLEVLHMARSGLNDEGLLNVGKSCSGLVILNLEDCAAVTTKGVKDIVSRCKRLKEINLKGCIEVDSTLLNWMVFSRPSLKKIITPCYNATSDSYRRLLLHHGCQICED